MKRAVIALVLALAALALLVSLALESRPLPVETHVAQYTIDADLKRIDEDFRSLAGALEKAWQEQQPPGEGARALLTRVTAAPSQLPTALFALRGNSGQEARLANSHETFVSTITSATTLAGELIDDETEYAASVAYLRESGAGVIQKLRDAGFDRAATDTFQLVVGTLGYAGQNASVRPNELERLLVTLGRDSRVDQMPGDVERLRTAVSSILKNKTLIDSKLKQLVGAPIGEFGTALGSASADLYASAVTRVDQARLMLAVYAVVLLVAVAFVALRLHASYREINAANTELAVLNESLEQRVAERTHELSSALGDLKESQVQLVQAEKMSSLGQLVAGISHEINTPLLYLTNNAELVQERLGTLREFVMRSAAAFSIKSEDFQDRTTYQTHFVNALKDVKALLRDEELEAAVEEIQDLTRDSIAGLVDLTEMAQSLKDFSRLDRAPIASFDVNGGLDKTLLIAKNVIKHKANVVKHYGQIPEIECSPSQINQVFLNIITNAAQAIETQGTITITTQLHEPAHVAIRIEDTGCGIPEENLGRIRDPFFTTKEVGTGTGLGLSIVDEIVRSHHGQLLVESEVGKGSAFTVVLPIKRPAGAAMPQPEPAAQADDDFGLPPLAEAV
ncbi:MAG TPA: ATP-binding protein [Gammaproteobacteria bacterium]|jgi:signal transduction histidine kinase|nr:ATP-binding protein [Gammaproteobacteria bacterium]